MNRRNFLKTVGLTVGTAVTGSSLKAEEASPDETDTVGILVDTTQCLGCRTCEYECAEANGLPEPDDDDDLAFAEERTTTDKQWTVVNLYETDAGEVFVKKQCMHCLQPACTSACLTNAMQKTKEGPVIWRENKCMGCRFCMISCPFDMPKFEYDSPNPKIQKCQMCWERLQEGQQPACVENCPGEALIFGKRSELIETARKRIYENPDDYNHHIYGEHEVGGTGWLYLASVPFDQLGFRTDLGTRPYPEFTREFLYAVPVALTLGPAFLLALSNATKRDEDQIESED